MTPDYWDKAKRSLAQNDPVLGSVIRSYKGDSLKLRGKGFQTLSRAIVGQQISVKAADSIWKKLRQAVLHVTSGAWTACRFTSHRKYDFRKGQRLGAGDHIVVWPKPLKPRTIDRKTYATLPDSLTVRECRVRIEQPGFRVTTLVIATTLLDAEAYTKSDLAELYRAR